MATAIAGDPEALAELLRRHGPQVRRRLHIGTVWRSALDVADVMQVTYLEAFLRIGQLTARTAAGFSAWLARIAQNNLRDALKELQRQRRPSPRRRVTRRGSITGTTLLSRVPGATRTASSTAARRESRQALATALAQLPPIYAQVVKLHDLEGLSIAEVSTALGRSPGSVCMLRARAVDRLRELLGSESRFFSRHA